MTAPLKKFVWDASALVALTGSNEQNHYDCYGFWKDNEKHIHIFSATAWMEYQAVLSKKNRQLRELYVLDGKNIVYDITHDFVSRVNSQGLHLKFSALRGMDLIYACIAFLENASLVTLDKDFKKIQGIELIYPNEKY